VAVEWSEDGRRFEVGTEPGEPEVPTTRITRRPTEDPSLADTPIVDLFPSPSPDATRLDD
jgi:hypothetical protein